MKTKKTNLSRRSWLKGALGGAMALPLLKFKSASADGPGAKKRFIVHYRQGGTVMQTQAGAPRDGWRPVVDNSPLGFSLTQATALSPLAYKAARPLPASVLDGRAPLATYIDFPGLAQHQSDLIFVDGLRIKVHDGDDLNGGNAHQNAHRYTLTGAKSIQPSSGEYAIGGGISIEQRIANFIQQSNPQLAFKSLHITEISDAGPDRISYAGPGQSLMPLTHDTASIPSYNLSDVYAEIAGTGALQPPDPAQQMMQQQLLAMRVRRAQMSQMVLSAAQQRYMTTKATLDVRDRTQLESYISSIDSIRQRLVPDLSGRTIACVQPDHIPEEGEYFHYFYDVMAAATREAIDLLVLAIACDLTRVGLLNFSMSDYRDTPTRILEDGDHYNFHVGWEHHTNGESKTLRDQVILHAANFNYASMAYLIQQLKAIPEGEGTVFDNTLVLGLNEFSEGSHEIHNAQPYILAGSCGGYFRTGRYRNYSTGNPDEPEYRASLSESSRFGAHNDLFLSILRAFGIGDATFGDSRFCSGPLAGLAV